MSDTIKLDQDHRVVVRGIAKDSSVTCTDTSAPDVYVHVITAKDTAELHKGDGTVIPKMTRTTIRLFRVDPSNAPFSATVVITDLPKSDSKKSDALMEAFSMMRHRPGAFMPAARKPARPKATT